MTGKPTTLPPESIVPILTVSERLRLFCVASDTDWLKAGIRPATIQVMMVRGLIEREHGASYRLTDQGRAVLDALLTKGRL